jgi:hypothetical protein
MITKGWWRLAVLVLLGVGCAAVAPKPATNTQSATVTVERNAQETIYGVTSTYDELGNDRVAADKPLPFKIKEEFMKPENVEIEDITISQGGRYVYIVFKSSPGVCYKFDTVQRKWRQINC